ncbi:MAG: hypothetical protein HXY50_13375 [Ignavibacteriaceae bacterium]|nr:hypothetical protein [Ignavibacteriaceae bacterium]
MDLDKLLNLLELPASELTEHKHTFVPYLYIDGHRSSGINDDDVESYKSGINFFLRFSEILKQLGFEQMVTMVHTNRNKAVAGRVHAIQKAIQEDLDLSNSIAAHSRFRIYGNLDEYLNNGSRKFYDYLNNVIEKTSRNTDFTHHILINYSEDWAISNLGTINNLPKISSVIRFTKGFVSGGWIPLKMQETTFVYSQLPSVSEFWSDEAILFLILVSFKNWAALSNYIGKKVYTAAERNEIHEKRDLELRSDTSEVNINSKMHNRIIIFGLHGPIIYEL